MLQNAGMTWHETEWQTNCGHLCGLRRSLAFSIKPKTKPLFRLYGEIRSANRTSWSQQRSGEAQESQNGSNSCISPSEVLHTASDSFEDNEVWNAADLLQPVFGSIDRLVATNIKRVQRAFAAAQVGPHHFAGSTGYGHGDLGRDNLDKIMAVVMGTESAIVRTQFVSGTHAIAAALFACLRPGHELIAVAGRPYDTLEEVIGIRGTPDMGSLADWGVTYRENKLKADGGVDLETLRTAVSSQGGKVALIQRSCGYSLRPTLTIKDIRAAVEAAKDANPDCLVVVDNCYGEFTESVEPGEVGADLVMGSLIKSPGGTIVTGGGYVAGRRDLIAAVGARLTAPGVGLDAGCVDGQTLRLMYQGLFLAPQMVGEALKGGRLLAEVFRNRGYSVYPAPDEAHSKVPVASFITAIQLGCPQAMQIFCQAVQQNSPVGSYVLPVPGQTAGYGDEVIFADGTFIDGSTAELSADGPIRPPYAVYCQGGTHWTHWAICLESILQALDQDKQMSNSSV